MSAAQETEWKPGIPLHRNPCVGHQSGFFNYRFEYDLNQNGDCVCPDRASWPEPLFAHDLHRYKDEITGESYA